jgi:CRISPR-associated protein Cas2
VNGLWIVSYDVADPGRLRRVARVLERYGCRVQLSVFECRLNTRTLAQARAQIAAEIDPREDDVRWYPLCAWCAGGVEWQGTGQPPDDLDYLIL